MVEKTKTQAQNSSQKLKKKTQALGGFFQNLKKLKKKTQNWMFFRGMIHSLSFLLPNMFKNRKFYTQRSKSFKICPKVSKIEGEIPKTQEKNTKLKEKTQALGGFHPTWETKWCYKKSLIYNQTVPGNQFKLYQLD